MPEGAVSVTRPGKGHTGKAMTITKQPRNTVSSEDQELRAWMQSQYGGLVDDRSTASYALEFLKTADSNLKLAQVRSNLALTCKEIERFVDYMEYCRKWLDELTPRAIELCDKVKVLSGQ